VFLSVPADSVRVATGWERPPASWLERLADVPASIAGDVLDRMTVIDGGIALRTSTPRMIGFALPVHVRSGDNLAIHRALDEARPGDILVVNGGGDTTRALVGDLIGEIMLASGVRGAVVDGAVRDVETLSDQGLAVYARAVTPAGPYKSGPGSIGSPVAVGGIVVGAGDLLIGDADGVVVVPIDRIEEVAREYEATVAKEEALRSRIRRASASATQAVR